MIALSASPASSVAVRRAGSSQTTIASARSATYVPKSVAPTLSSAAFAFSSLSTVTAKIVSQGEHLEEEREG